MRTIPLWLFAMTCALGAGVTSVEEESDAESYLGVQLPAVGSPPVGPAVAAPSFAQPGGGTTVEKAELIRSPELPRLTLLHCDENGASFEVSFPEALFTERLVDGGTYTEISLPGTVTEDVPGGIGLPFYRARLWVPPGAALVAEAFQLDTYEKSVDNPLPAPFWVEAGRGDMVSLVPEYSLDPALVEIPRPTVETDLIETVRGFRLAHFILRPVAWSDGRAKGARRIRVEVSFSYPAGRRPGAHDLKDSIWAEDLLSSLAPNFAPAQENGWRNPAPPPRREEFHSGLLPEPRLKVVVNSDGLYKITREDLARAGLDPDAVDPRRLTLYASSGKMLDFTDTMDADPLYPVPVYVSGEEDGSFDEGDALYFWGRGNLAWRPADEWDIAPADAPLPGEKNLNTAYSYYWLAESESPLRFVETDAAPAGEPLLAHLQGRMNVEQDDIDLARSPSPVRGMDFYFFKSVNSLSPTTLSYQIFDYEPRGDDALLALRFKPSILADSAAVLRVYVGSSPGSPGEAVISVTADQLGKLYEAWGTIDAWLLKSGTNSLTFELYSPYSEQTSSVNLDAFQVIYSRGPRMQSGILEGWGPPGVSGRRRLQATDFTGEELLIWDLTRGHQLVNGEESGPEGSRTVTFAWDAAPDYHLVVADAGSAKSVLDCYLDVPSDLHAPVAADVIYIAHPDLLPALDPLVQMHRDRGLRVMAVRVDDIYDEYSGGRLDPAAIRNFLYHAWTDCVGEPFTFVTLVGDTTYDLRDPKNRYDGPRWRMFPQALLPTAYVRDRDSSKPLVASDCYFASLLPEEQTSEDVPVPQVALTRISADDVADIEAVVGKLIAYPAVPPGPWQLRHVMLVDNTVDYYDDPPPGSEDEPINFDIYAENMLAGSLPGGMNHEKLYLTALGMARTGDSNYTPQKYDRGKRQWATREHVTPAFYNALSEPALVASFIGHGAWHTWTHELAQTNRPPLYRDFAEWDCPVPPLLIQSSCSVADFDRTPSLDPDCISELVLSLPGGAIAATGSTRLAGGDAQDSYHRGLFEAFYHPLTRLEYPAFGLAHMQNLLASGDARNRQRQMMFGDSASLLRRAEPRLRIDPPAADRVARGEVITVTGRPLFPGEPLFTGTVQIRAYDRPLLPYSYSYPIATRLYRLVGAASTEIVDGVFSTRLALPVGMNDDLSDYQIYPYTLELRVWMVDEATGDVITDAPFSGDGVWSLPIVGSVEPPADNEGPVVNLIFDDGRVASGDYIDGRVKLTAELHDPHGILLLRSDGGVPMASGEIDRPIVLVARAAGHSFDIDLTDDYSPAPGDYTRGTVERSLELPPGDYTLTLYCYDNFGEPGSASAELCVAESLGLSDVLVVPNPAPGPTAFTFFSSTRPDQARIRIYTPIGRLVRTIETNNLAPGFNVVEWDGTDWGGRPLANGVYIYSLEVRDGEEVSKAFEKFIMLR